MASKFSKEEQAGQLRPRKGHDPTWPCDKHGYPIKFYCNNHVTPICHPCATKDHVKQQCELVDIEDVILEMEGKLQEKCQEIEETKERLRLLKSDLTTSETSARDHFRLLDDDVISIIYECELEGVNDKERDDICLINKEADGEIGLIDEKRERRIKECNAEAERRRGFIKESRSLITSDAEIVRAAAEKLIGDLGNKVEHATNELNTIDHTIKDILQTDKALVTRGPQALARLDEFLRMNNPRDIRERLDQIDRNIQHVAVAIGIIGGQLFARIDGYSGKWELVRTLDIPSMVNDPWVCGSISEDEICVRDMLTNHLYVTNLKSKHTVKVLEGDKGHGVSSCTELDRNSIVCGKWQEDCAGDTMDGCITIYDRHWKVIRDITIPRNASGPDKPVYVDVDPDGMILAAQRGQSNAYVIDPADGKILSQYALPVKVGWCGFRAMSSGGVVLKGDLRTKDPNTHPNQMTIVSRYGVIKRRVACKTWYIAQCSVDRLTDTIYTLHWNVHGATRDIHGATRGVDVVSRQGKLMETMIVEFPRSSRANYVSECVVTPSGILVVCNGEKFFLYKKSFAL